MKILFIFIIIILFLSGCSNSNKDSAYFGFEAMEGGKVTTTVVVTSITTSSTITIVNADTNTT